MSDEVLGLNDEEMASLTALTSRVTFNLIVQVLCLMVWTAQSVTFKND